MKDSSQTCYKQQYFYFYFCLIFLFFKNYFEQQCFLKGKSAGNGNVLSGIRKETRSGSNYIEKLNG